MPRSFKEFWTGVPDMHHRADADRLITALNCAVDGFRTTWAAKGLAIDEVERKQYESMTFIKDKPMPKEGVKNTTPTTKISCHRTIG